MNHDACHFVAKTLNKHPHKSTKLVTYANSKIKLCFLFDSLQLNLLKLLLHLQFQVFR